MGRLINASFSFKKQHPELAGIEEGRTDTRNNRLMPVAIFLGGHDEDSVLIGFTRDLSIEGVGLVTTREIPLGELLLVIGGSDDRCVLRANCLHSHTIGYGCFQAGLRLTQILQAADYAPLLEYVDYLEECLDARVATTDN